MPLNNKQTKGSLNKKQTNVFFPSLLSPNTNPLSNEACVKDSITWFSNLQSFSSLWHKARYIRAPRETLIINQKLQQCKITKISSKE